jgi:hypothetical protein
MSVCNDRVKVNDKKSTNPLWSHKICIVLAFPVDHLAGLLGWRKECWAPTHSSLFLKNKTKFTCNRYKKFSFTFIYVFESIYLVLRIQNCFCFWSGLQKVSDLDSKPNSKIIISPASFISVRYRSIPAPDWITLFQYHTDSGILISFNSGTRLTGCGAVRHSKILYEERYSDS